MSSSLDVRSLLRRLKPDKHRKPLERRDSEDLPYIDPASRPLRALLYDTTVYVDILQGRFPTAVEVAIRAAHAWHSTVTAAELIASCGLLNPADPRTAETTRRICAIIERRPAHRTIAPDGEVWLVAGLLSGTLARLHGYGAAERRRVLNDALIFATARKFGLTVLTRNTGDFDFLQQLDPTGRVVFYEPY